MSDPQLDSQFDPQLDSQFDPQLDAYSEDEEQPEAQALAPKSYAAPRPSVPVPTKKQLELVLQAQLEPHPGSAAPLDRLERHVLLTVRPGESGGEYANRRVVGWMREIERIGADALAEGDHAQALKAFGDLTRMWQVQQTRDDRKAEQAQKNGQGGDLHLHQHNHQHSEIPDLSRVPTDQLSDLAQAFLTQASSAKRDPRRRMDREEMQAYEAHRARDVTPRQSRTEEEGA